MKITLARAAAPIALLFAAPAFSDEPNGKEKAETAQDAATKEKGDEAAPIIVPEVKAEEKRICRRVKLDMSSRRATKVCKTKDEWRDFNQRR
uniref:hypothetical protein n=1 Tax=uncultured Erythrobacter sp. TaxID=263913 RepID=UPI00261CA579|nr:hypothetical protein [uncultured Erythrobacter sp.]